VSKNPPVPSVEWVSEYTRFALLGERWNGLLARSVKNSPFLTHQWFDAWWKSFGAGKGLEILLVKGGTDDLVGLAPLMNAGGKLSFMASAEVTDYCDFIFREGCEERFFAILLECLIQNSSNFSGMEFMNIPEGSPTLSAFPRLARVRGFVCEMAETDVVPSVLLPDSYGKYLENLDRKDRHELRRKVRRLESSGPVRIERITGSQDAKKAVRKFISLHRKGGPARQAFWKKPGMPDFFLELASRFSSRNWLDIFLLYSGERLIGGLIDFAYEDRLYLYNVAYGRDFSSLSPGFYLFDHSIKLAIEEGMKTADFLRGGEKYKYFFGAKDSKIYTLTMSRKERRE
jgi:CelD/BcsL family acetyltransferase involved in cellulose biosynthesis